MKEMKERGKALIYLAGKTGKKLTSSLISFYP